MRIASNTMQRDNQKRLFEALCRISDENNADDIVTASYSILDHSNFFSEIPVLSKEQLEASNAPASLCVEPGFSLPTYEHSETTFAYNANISQLAEAPMQVDHCGTKVDESRPSCKWIPKSVPSDLSCSVSVSACSYTNQSPPPQTGNPTVSAAAVTAAMIVDRVESAPKRPRSSTAETEDDSNSDCFHNLINCDDADDNATEASLDESDCAQDYVTVSHDMNNSPRAIKDFPQLQSTTMPLPRVGGLTANSPLKPVSTNQNLEAELAGKQMDNNHNNTVPPGQACNQDFVPQTPMRTDTQRDITLSRKRRAEAMERFRRKKAVRSFGRKVRYQVRKRIATTRPRVNGRFARLADAGMHASHTQD